MGEALVGNEAVDQLVKFNQSLADYAALGVEGRLIDGIVLTKFDTIDDKVSSNSYASIMGGSFTFWKQYVPEFVCSELSTFVLSIISVIRKYMLSYLMALDVCFFSKVRKMLKTV